MKETGGFCLPDFGKKGVNVWFAVDNIDLLEDTPTGQNTFHGTVIVMNQQDEDGKAVNQPLVIPETLPSPTLRFDVKYLQEPIIRTKPITHTWALANYNQQHRKRERHTNRE